MNQESAKKIADKTIADYNRIADDFSNKRSYLTSDIIALKHYAGSSGRVLDLGCGNGRVSEMFDRNYDYIGVDTSIELVKKAKEKYPQRNFMLLEGLDLPFKEGYFDTVFCLAVMHHLPGKQYREEFLAEALRVLKPGGRAVFTVWNMWAKPGTRRSVIKYKLLHPTEFDLRDILYPFKNSQGKSVVLRYIHCFTESELAKLVRGAGFTVIESRVDSRGRKQINENIVMIVEKPK